MSKGPPYRYEQSASERNRGRFGQPESRREMGSPYKRPRRPSATDFSLFNYDDMPGQRHQEVGLGNFNDFSAISRDIVLDRESKREERSAVVCSSLSIQTSNLSHGTSPSSISNITPLTIKVSPTPHSPVTPSTPKKCGSLLSSFQPSDHRFLPHLQPSSPYKTTAKSPMQLSPRIGGNLSSGHGIHGSSFPMCIAHTVQSTGLLIQASSMDAMASFTKSVSITSIKDELYQPKVEAVSPSNSENEAERNTEETPKEVDKNRTNELLKHMEKVDKEIAEVEKKISDLKEKQKNLEEELSQEVIDPEKPESEDDKERKEEEEEEEDEEEEEEETKNEGVNGIKEENKNNSVHILTPEPKLKSLIERIYEENRQKAWAAHQQFAKMGIPLPNSLPMYNQPSDLPFYEENRKNGKPVKLRLIKYFQRKRKEKTLKQRNLLEEYRVLGKRWLEKVEKLESNPKRKAKELRVRDFYEKIFPEIKKQREQTERFSRLGSRANWGLAARSEAEYNEILKDLTEKETHEKHMRDLAVDPPALLDEDQRRIKFINNNGLIKDLKAYVNDHNMLNVWMDKEKEVFKQKYIQCPKDFKYIAGFLENKSVKDCVLYYYRTKRTAKFKKLSRKQTLKRKRFSNPSGKEDIAKSKILKPRTEGYHTESDIDDEEGFDEDSDGSEGSSSRVNVSTSAGHPVRLTTPQAGGKPEPVETPRWSKNEREIAIEGLRSHGRNWTAISQMVMTKTEAQCKNFYFNYKKKLDLESVVAQYNASQVQRQESEETMSASEVSDDGYDGHNEEKLIIHISTKPNQSTRETRSQTAEKHEEPSPSSRNPRPQRILRPRLSDAKTCVLPRIRAAREMSNPDTKPAVPEKEVTAVGTAGSDDGRIIVDDIEENETGHEVIVRNVVDAHEYLRSDDVSRVESPIVMTPVTSCDVTGATMRISDQPRISHTATPPVLESASLLDRQSSVSAEITRRESTHIIQRTSSVHAPVKSNTSLPPSLVSIDVLPRPIETPTTCFVTASTSMYPSVLFRPHHRETHAEALQKLAKNVTSSCSGHGGEKQKLEESDEAKQEKVKFQRVPDPQLPKVEQKEAIGTYSRFSPCIPPDTTSRQQVRTQGFPPSSLHPTSPLVSSFVPHIPHPGHFSPEMFPISIGRGPPGYPFYPPYIEYLQHPGMDPEHLVPMAPYPARLMEEPAAMHHGHAMWPLDGRGILVGPHPPFIMTNEMHPLTPPEVIPRIRESTGHVLNSSAPSKRCRSVEAAVMRSGVHSPESNMMNELRPGAQQRSSSMTDVHARVTAVSDERRTSPFDKISQSPKEHVSDQVKSYEPFTALMNVAVVAAPMTSGEEHGRAQQERERKLKLSEAERAQVPPHFTRQSCIATNTSVIQATCFDAGIVDQHLMSSDRPRYGISTGLVPKPPPLTPITGIRAQALARQSLSPDTRHGPVTIVERTPIFGLTKDTGRGGHDMVKLEARPNRTTLTPPASYSHTSHQQHPPPLVRNTLPFGIPERPRVISPFTDIMMCGCYRSNEPCKHELYSQGVPYISRLDALPSKMTSVRHENEAVTRASAIAVSPREIPTETSSRASTHLFRPWMENFNMEKDVIKTNKPKTSPSGIFSTLGEPSERSRFTKVSPSARPPAYRCDQREQPWTTGPLELSTTTDPFKSLRNPHHPPRQSMTSPFQEAFRFGLPPAVEIRSRELPPYWIFPPSLSHGPMISPEVRTQGILVETDSVCNLRRPSERVSSSEEGLGSSDQRIQVAATRGDVRSILVESNLVESNLVESSPEGVTVSSDDDDGDYAPDSTPGRDRGAEVEHWDKGAKKPNGSRDPEEPTSCCSSSECEGVVSSGKVGVIRGSRSRHEIREPKKSGGESSEGVASNMAAISTSQSDSGDFQENSLVDGHVESSLDAAEPVVYKCAVSGDCTRQRPCEEMTGEESARKMQRVMEDMRDDGGYGGDEGMRGMEDGVLSSMEEAEVVSCGEDEDEVSEGMGEHEVISGTDGYVEDVAGEDDEIVNIGEEKILHETTNDGSTVDEELEDIEDGGVVVEDNMSAPEDCVTSSVERGDTWDSRCDDGMLGGISEEKDVRHFGNEAEDEVVMSGSVDDGVDVGDIEQNVGIVGVKEGCMDEDRTREDSVMDDEVRSSDDILKYEHEAIESDDEMEENEKKDEEEEERVQLRGLMDIEGASETEEDNGDSRIVSTEEQEWTSEDNAEHWGTSVDTTDAENNVNIEREYESQEDTEIEMDVQDEECAVSSASHSDVGGRTLLVSPLGENDASDEIDSAAKSTYRSPEDRTGSDESETAMASRIIAAASLSPIHSPRYISNISISQKNDDDVSTSAASSWSTQVARAHGNESPGSSTETSEARTTLDKTPVHYQSTENLPNVHSVSCLDDSREAYAEPVRDLDDVTDVECSDEPSTTNPEGESSDERRVKAWAESDVSETALSGNEAESSVTFDEGRDGMDRDVGGVSANERDALVDSSSTLMVSSSEDVDNKGFGSSSTDQEDMVGARHGSPSHTGDSMGDRGRCSTPGNTRDIDDGVTSAGVELQKYGNFEEISSDEECSELEEGEIAETLGEHDDVTLTQDTLVQTSGSYFPPLDIIPISPPGSDDCQISDTTFLEWGGSYPSTQPHAGNANDPTNELASTSRVSHSVPFPYSALNVRSASNSNCSSPRFASGCSTPVIMQRQDSNNTLSEHYEPLSDDENGEREIVQTLPGNENSSP